MIILAQCYRKSNINVSKEKKQNYYNDINHKLFNLYYYKPEMNPDKDSPVCKAVSYMSFGHAGFTGTLAWADPKTGIIYIFLSNRVYPDADDNKLSKTGTRGKIHAVIYDAFK